MTASTADYYSVLGLRPDATLADVKKAYRKLARQHHPDRNNADPGSVDRFRRITEAYEYLSAYLKDNANGNGYRRPGPAAPPKADTGMPGGYSGMPGGYSGMPGGYSEAASRVLAMLLEETWQATRARHSGNPPVVIIIASGTTGRATQATGTLTRILLIQTAPVTPVGVPRPGRAGQTGRVGAVWA